MNFCVLVFFCATNLLWVYGGFIDRPNQYKVKIVGGHEALPHSHPYIVSLQIRFLWVRTHMCGGSLLNEQWILTAGHCVKGTWLLNWLGMDAVAGTHNVDKYSAYHQISPIEKRVPHPLYQGDIGPNDIALVKTKNPFTFTSAVQPIRLPFHEKYLGESFKLVGWGVIRTFFFIPITPSKLQEVDVTYMSYEDCYNAVEDIKESNEDNPLDEESNICSGPISGGVAACSGDSGGPLIQYVTKEVENVNDTTEEAEDVTEQEEYLENTVTDVDDSTVTDESNNNLQNVIQARDNSDSTDEIPVLVGVVSWGATPCGEKGAPTVYTKVTQFLDFINQNINS